MIPSLSCYSCFHVSSNKAMCIFQVFLHSPCLMVTGYGLHWIGHYIHHVQWSRHFFTEHQVIQCESCHFINKGPISHRYVRNMCVPVFGFHLHRHSTSALMSCSNVPPYHHFDGSALCSMCYILLRTVYFQTTIHDQNIWPVVLWIFFHYDFCYCIGLHICHSTW